MGVQNNDHKEENELQPHFLFLLEYKSLNMYVCLFIFLWKSLRDTMGFQKVQRRGLRPAEVAPKDREEVPAHTLVRLQVLFTLTPCALRDGLRIPFWDWFC